MLNEMYYYLRKEQKKLILNVSLDKKISSDESEKSLTVGDVISDSEKTGSKSVEEKILNNELRKILFDCISYLEDDEQYLIIYRYGLDNNVIKTQNEIAKILKMSQANISKLERHCLSKLRLIMKKHNYEYHAKTMTKDNELAVDLGANQKFNYLDKFDINNIAIIAAEQLKIHFDEIIDVISTDNKNEFLVTFKTNTRVYGIVNNITNYVTLEKVPLSNEEKFMSLILDIPFLNIPKKSDLETDKYNICYSKSKLKRELSKLTDNEKYIVENFYGLYKHKHKLTQELSNELGLSVDEIVQIRTKALEKLRKNFIKKR